MSSASDAEKFATVLKGTRPLDLRITIGKLTLYGIKGVSARIASNMDEIQLLGDAHEYTYPLPKGDLQVSLQLYENISDHYRLFCYNKINGMGGMLFSINLTTEKEASGIIFLNQRIKFSEGREADKEINRRIRREKQQVLCDMLRLQGLEVTDTNDLVLGIFDTSKSVFLNTTPEKFVLDFLRVSILKGHFMGNKGYQLETIRSYVDLMPSTLPDRSPTDLAKVPERVRRQATNRAIPLILRYKVFERDNGRCVLCGASPRNKDIILHVDHIVPFSKGGLTTLDNLRTLCSDCNLGKRDMMPSQAPPGSLPRV